MTRALLGQAGLPACFWPEAAPCATFLRNLSLSGRGPSTGAEGAVKSPCELVSGEQFAGQL
eukprot:4531086-Alexandrium_andersonii.AAC.1